MSREGVDPNPMTIWIKWWFATFPQNPEILLDTEVTSEEFGNPLLILNNPLCPLLPSDSEEIAMCPNFYWTNHPHLLTPLSAFPTQLTTIQSFPWTSSNLDLLRTLVLTPTTEKLGARPCLHLGLWKMTCGGDEFMARGMQPSWKDPLLSPQRLAELSSPRQHQFNDRQQYWFDKTLADQLDQKIVMRVPSSYGKLISPVFMVEKKGGEMRQVWDGRRLNEEQVDIHFRMEGPETVRRLLIQRDWATSLDLKSAFNHLRVDKALRPFLCFSRDGKYYTYRAMPFGAKQAPRLFTEALSFAATYIRKHWDVRMVCYMDDVLLLHQDPQHLQTCTWQIAAYLSSLGWTLSVDKCDFIPAQIFKFLGWHWNSLTLSLQMTPEMQRAIYSQIVEVLKLTVSGGIITSRKLAAFIGSLNFLRAQFPRASLYLRSLHSVLARAVNSVGWTGSFSLTSEVRSELLFWSRNVRVNTPYCFAPRQSKALLTTDASEEGWGAHLEIGPRHLDTFGFFLPADCLSSSNQRETTAVLRALTFFKPVLELAQIHAMTVRSDNTVTVFNLQRQGAGPALLHMTRAIFKLLQKLDIRLHVCHIPGILNDVADSFSRIEVTGDYSLNPEIYLTGIQTLQVQPTIDWFAHTLNHKCLRFAAMPNLSHSLSESATMLNAFSNPWNLELGYLFPPVQLVDRVLQKIRFERASAVVVLPNWPSQPWWGLFRPMAKLTVELGRSDQILTPGPAMTSSSVKKKLPPGNLLMALLMPPY